MSLERWRERERERESNASEQELYRGSERHRLRAADTGRATDGESLRAEAAGCVERAARESNVT